MVGDIDELVDACKYFVPVHLKEAVGIAAHFLLWAQYIQIPGDGRMFKVKFGSGMGLPHSGEVSDAMLLMRELSIPSYGFKNGMVGYVRFKDDALIVINPIAPGSVALFWRHYIINVRPYRVVADSVSNKEFIMLDMHFFKGVRW